MVPVLEQNLIQLTAPWTKAYNTVHIVGDIHGHESYFIKALSEAGLDLENYLLPSNTLVIQVGDLVHGGGLHQTNCLAIAKRLLANNPRNYIQLLGNHEAHYLDGPDVSSRDVFRQLDTEGINILQQLNQDKQMHLAVSLTFDGKEYLITHGGLTKGFYDELGDHLTAKDAADALNLLLSQDHKRAFRPGWLMTNEYDLNCGVLGPRTGAELAQSWLGHIMPFNQLHGHESTWDWAHNAWHKDVPDKVKELTRVNEPTRQSEITIGEKSIISLDAKFDAMQTNRAWQAYILPGKDKISTK